MLELPTNRADYVGVLQDLGDYPARSPIGQRVPTQADVDALKRGGGPWCGVVMLDDERAARQAALVFDRVFVLDPFYDSGALLYAAWHDPYIKDEHSRRLAEQTRWLVRLAPLFNTGSAVLAPDHLPGSWSPRPGWRKPRGNTNPRQVGAWAMRNGLVLLYWADRLDAVACTTRIETRAALDVALGPDAQSVTVGLGDVSSADEAQRLRDAHGPRLCEQWRAMRHAVRRRSRRCLEDASFAMAGLLADAVEAGRLAELRLAVGPPSVPEPAMLIRRVLNGQDPDREPALPRRRLKRRPLCLLAC
jgi:hypothetical protein